MARLKEQYVNEIAPALNKKFGYKSVMQIPKLDKVIINVAAGEAKENVKVIDAIVADLGQITGQKAVVCKAKKSVANFKLRQGMPIGAKVRGMDICFVTTAKTDEEAKELLKALGAPFAN